MNYLFPEIGNILLIFAFVVCTCFLAYFLKYRKIIDEVNVVCSRVVFLQFGLISLSFLFLVLCFITDDFSVINVAQNSNSKLPWYYKITASWGSHEGSILLWLLVLNFWTFLITIVPNNIEKKVFNDVIVVQNIITLGLYLFVLLTSNPFDRFNDPPFDGRDLNPLLQDPGMIFHPPLLYLGYVGFSIVFSLAIAGLVSGKLDSKWARWSRPWTILAWSFLTFGIGLGSWWAYNELGWGGWWFWDPVENASLMPWLCATALIHSLIVSEKLGIFKNWTILLAISTFSLSLLGTFLVRSGVITSVHAFASDPARGVFILCFLFLLVGSSLTLYSFRMKNVISQNLKNFFSKEFFLLLNNVIMIASTFTVLLGTIYPIVMDIFGLSKISIGPPYYEKLLAPIFLPMFFLMAFSILINWKKNTLQITVKQISKIIVVAFIFCLFLNLLTKFEFNFVLSVMLFLILLPAISVFSLILKPDNFRKIKFNFLVNKSGMYFSHIGVAIFAFGVLYVNSFDIESDSKISIGEKINVGSYIIKLESTKNIKGSNYDGIQGIFKVNDINGRDLGFLYPEKRFYVTQKTTMTESSVKKIWFDDLYLSLGEQLDNETWIIRAYYKPFIMFLWIGVILIGLGGIFSLLQYYSFNSSTLYVKKINFLFIPLLLFCFFCIILYRGLFNDPKVVSSPLLGKQVPNISYPVLNQAIGEINIKDIDGPYLINIFASWCLPCVEELPVLINEKNKKRVKIIGVNYKDDPVNANNWLATYGNPYDVVLFDKDGMKSIDLGVYGVPETFFIDTNKIIKDKKIGVLDAKFVSDNL